MTAYERTGFRDQWISQRHRTWSSGPVTNVDCVLTETGESESLWLEYNHCLPVACIEYKHRNARLKVDSNFIAQRLLANLAGLPFFLVQYDPEVIQFCVYPGNKIARRYLDAVQVLDEDEYVALLKILRQPVDR